MRHSEPSIAAEMSSKERSKVQWQPALSLEKAALADMETSVPESGVRWEVRHVERGNLDVSLNSKGD